jgi:rhodanese-related sulfurtransferase
MFRGKEGFVLVARSFRRQYTTISPKDVAAFVQKTPNAIVLDVREVNEVAVSSIRSYANVGYIPTSVLQFYSSTEERRLELEVLMKNLEPKRGLPAGAAAAAAGEGGGDVLPRDTPIIVVCHKGIRSARACVLFE